MIVIPNSKLGTTIYTNFYLPEPRMTMSVSFGVASDSDLELVEKILLDEVTAATQTIPGMLAEPAPSVRFNPGPSDWSLVYQVNFSVAAFGEQYQVQSELRKRLYKRLVQENISMPYPTRTVILESKPGAAG
jgi:small-conductance mechanosensitive channel